MYATPTLLPKQTHEIATNFLGLRGPDIQKPFYGQQSATYMIVQRVSGLDSVE